MANSISQMSKCQLPSLRCGVKARNDDVDRTELRYNFYPSLDFSVNKIKNALSLFNLSKKQSSYGKSDVTYKNHYKNPPKEMNLHKILLINKSPHTYCVSDKNIHADAELIMFHKDDTNINQLLICVPVLFSKQFNGFLDDKNDSIMSSKASQMLKLIINSASEEQKNTEEENSGRVNDINVNNFIPLNKRYYTYSLDDNLSDHNKSYLNDSACFGIKPKSSDMIIFDMKDVYILLDDKSVVKRFKSMTKPIHVDESSGLSSESNTDTAFGSMLTWLVRGGVKREGFENDTNDDIMNDDNMNDDNMNDDNMNDNNMNDDNMNDNNMNDDNMNDDNDIYIDCRPTGVDGKALYEEDLSLFKPSISLTNYKSFGKTFDFLNEIKNSPILYISIGLLIAYLIIKFGRKGAEELKTRIQTPRM